MPVNILIKSPYLIKIYKSYVFQKIIGLFIMASSIIVFVAFMILQPQRMGKTTSVKAFSILLIISLIFFLIREFYFFVIDKDNLLAKIGNKCQINERNFLLEDICSILIVKYNGIGIMSNGYNIFLKLKSGKNIPISIRVSENDKEKVKNALSIFFNMEKLETKKWLIS